MYQLIRITTYFIAIGIYTVALYTPSVATLPPLSDE